MTAIRARLDGHVFDLDTLTWLFPAGDPRVGKDTDSQPYYLMSGRLDGLFERPAELHEAASTILQRVCGAARALSDDFRPVRLVGRYGDETGRVQQVVFAETAEAREQALPVTAVLGGVTQQERTPGPGYVSLGDTDPDVAEVLLILGRDTPALNWIELYKIFEIIRHNLAPRRVQDVCSTTEREIKAFTASANRPDVSGVDARHARLPGQPPARAMVLGDAHGFVNQLVIDWLEALSFGARA